MEIRFTEEQKVFILDLLEPIIDRIADRLLEKVGKQMETKEPRYYTRHDVCALMGITLPTLYSYTKKGYLPAFKTGRKVLYDAWAVDEAIRTKKVYKGMRT